jgi:SOS-response transcriptional repressor LexA
MKKNIREQELSASQVREVVNLVRVPIVSSIGAARSADNLQIDEWQEIHLLKPRRQSDIICGAIINGDSLSDEGIYDGDCVVVRKTFDSHEITQGRLVAVFTPYGFLIKRIYRTMSGQVRLVSSNPAYEDIVLDIEEIVIQGVVEQLVRNLS